MKKLLTGVVASVVALMLMSGTAHAHRCTIASRSEQGNTQVAAHSNGWLSPQDFLAREGLCDEGIAYVLEGLGEWGNLTFHGNATLAHKLSERHAGLLNDGRGVDHLSDEDFAEIIPLFMSLVEDARALCG